MTYRIDWEGELLDYLKIDTKLFLFFIKRKNETKPLVKNQDDCEV